MNSFQGQSHISLASFQSDKFMDFHPGERGTDRVTKALEMNYLRDERYCFGLFTSYYVFLEGSNKNIFDPGLCVNLLAFSNILPGAPYPGHGFLSAVGHLGDAREILRPDLGTESSLLEFHT